MSNEKSTQVQTIIEHLRRVGSISFAEAWDAYGIRSLTRRITDIRRAGYNISAVLKKHAVTGQRYKRYFLVGVGA